CVVTVSATGGTNFADTSTTFTLTVDQATQTITLSPASATITYSAGDSYQINASTNGDGTLGYLVSSGTCSVDGSGLITGAGAGTCVVTVSATGGTNFADTSTTFTLTVDQATQTITLSPASATITYSAGDSYQINASTNGDGTLGYLVSSGTCSVDGSGLITGAGAGTCVVTVSATGGTNFADTSTTFTLTVDQATQTITLSPASATITYSAGDSYQINASTNGDGTLGYLVSSGTCSVDGSGLITGAGAGTCVVTVSATGGTNFADTSTTFTLTVDQATQTITLSPASATITYSAGDSYQINASTNGDGTLGYLVSSGTCSVDGSGLITGAGAGTCVVTVSATGGTNFADTSTTFTLTVDQATQTITLSPASATITYSAGDSYQINASTNGDGTLGYLVSSGTCSVDGSGLITGAGAGTCVVTVSATGGTNFADTSTTFTLTVDQATQTITLSPASATITYSAGDSYQINASTNGDGTLGYLVSSGTCSVDGSGLITGAGAGTCVVTVSATGGTNFADTSTTFTLTVDQATQTITLSPASATITYSAGDSYQINASTNGDGTLGYLVSSGTCSVDGSGLITGAGAGTCVVTVSATGGTNFADTSTTFTLTVDQATQTITLSPASATITYSAGDSYQINASTNGDGTLGYLVSSGTCSVDGSGLITGAGAGTCVVTVSATGGTNFADTSTTFTLTVDQATQTITLSPASATITYSAGDSYQINASTNGDGTLGYLVSSGTCSVDGSGLITGAGAGTCVVTVSATGGTNFADTSTTFTLTVDQATQTITLSPASATITYSAGDSYQINASTNGDGTLGYLVSSGTCSVDGSGLITGAGAGTCVVTVSATGGTNFADTSTTFTLTVDQATQTITLSPASATITYSAGDSYQINASTNGDGTLGYLVSSGTCSVDGSGLITGAGAGTCVVTVSATGGTNFADTSTTFTLTVDQATQTITLSPASATITYSAGDSYQINASTNGDGTLGYLVSSGTCSVDGSGLITGAGAGTCVVTVSATGGTNFADTSTTFTLTVDQATQTITLSPASATITYSAGDSYQINASTNGDGTLGYLVSSGTCSVDGSGLITGAGAGTCVVTVSATGGTNFADTSTTFTLTVDQATQTITLSPASATITYSAGDSYQINASTNGDGTLGYLVSSGTCSVDGSGLITGAGAGTCVVTVSATGGTNFADTSTTFTLTVDQATQTITLSPASATITYSAGDSYQINASTNGDGTLGYLVSSGTCSVDGSGLITGAGAGTCVVTVSATGGTNFADTSTTFTLTVDQATQTITLSPASATITYSAGDSYQINASTNGDGTLGYLVSSGTCSVDGSGLITGAGAGTCVVTVSATGGTNFADTSTTFTLTVDQATQTITLSPASATITYSAGDSYQINASTNGDGTLGYLVSSGPCSVDGSGLITGARAGTCVVTVSATGGTNFADTSTTFTLTVDQATQSITL